jgi:hypothetical protein
MVYQKRNSSTFICKVELVKLVRLVNIFGKATVKFIRLILNLGLFSGGENFHFVFLFPKNPYST